MLKKEEYEEYRAIVEGKEIKEILSGIDPGGISELGAKMSVYYARLSGELADVKDDMLTEFLVLTSPVDGGKGMTATRAEKESEAIANSRREVTRRQIDYLMKGLDKISFACSARVRSFNKEGHF